MKTDLFNELVEEYSIEAVNAFIELFGKDELENFRESYGGKYSSDEEMVKELLDGTGEIPKDLPPYVHIDWEWTAKEIMMDYSEQDGHYFRCW